MRITSLQLTNFRNYKHLSLGFSKNAIVFVGKNSSGKTNILEAIELLSLSKSFRKASDVDIIHWNEDFFDIEAQFVKQKEGLRVQARFAIREQTKEKRFFINGTKSAPVEFLGTVLTVLFSPDDVSLFMSPPSTRRRFFDLTLCKTSPAYCTSLLAYAKVLVNRNRLLQQIHDGKSQINELWYWDEKLVELGSDIIFFRLRLAQFLHENLDQLYDTLARHPGKEKKSIRLEYNTLRTPFGEAVVLEKNALREIFRKKLEHSRERDLVFCTTHHGPHRDDFHLVLNEKPLVDIGSRGDHRIAVLALKLLQKKYLTQETGTSPLLLLDDVYSELDSARRDALTEFFKGNQVIITTADTEALPQSIKDTAQQFSVRKGRVQEVHEKELAQ